MFEQFIKYIRDYSGQELTNEEVTLIKTTFEVKRLRKRQYFLREGEVCKYFAFIVKGALRQYQFRENDKENIVYLGIENWWTGDRESFVRESPSIYNIDAWEDSQLIVITKANADMLAEHIPAYDATVRLMDERYAIAMQKRLNSFISLSAEQRYSQFVQTHPLFFQRFPLKIIASYLGVTKETLSRIRSIEKKLL